MRGCYAGHRFCSATPYIDREIIWKNQRMLGILEVQMKKRMCCCFQQTTHPPVCQELACRAISCIVPQYSLNFTRLSNSRLSRNGVRHCLLPQSNPNLLMLFCNQAAHPPRLVFCLLFSQPIPLLCFFPNAGGISDEPDRTRNLLQASY